MSNAIHENIAHVKGRVKRACKQVDRNPQDVQIIPVTKTVEPYLICKAVACGYQVLGENRVQEAERKLEPIYEYDPDVKWHFIGHLQSNKVNKVVRFASMVQSIDRMKIVRKMNRRLNKVDKTIDVLVQVNVSNEDSKFWHSS